jgi:hypothetical protein
MPNTYTELVRTVVGTATSTVTFSSIPSGYTDLVLVSSLLGTVGQNQNIRFNNDSATNYSNTYLEGDGSSAYSGRRSNQTYLIDFGVIRTTANTFSTNILQILNYSNTTTFKTALTRNGLASTALQAVVGLWRSTSAINRIDLSPGSGNFEVGSTFSLYGIANADLGAAKATGGIITEDSQYWYHTFGASGAFIPKQSLTCDVLVVAGGGGGGRILGGGGGAGGLEAFTSQALTATSYNVTVGAGGPGSTTSGYTSGTVGVDSQFASLTLVKGGGAGGGLNLAGGNGGSGGGAGGSNPSKSGGTALSTQGTAGGTSNISGANVSAGGGGAGAVGQNSQSATLAGAGGNGVSTYSSWGVATGIGENVSGTYWFAGGGGGGGSAANGTAANAGAGGSGGGGRGGFTNVTTTTDNPGISGLTNTGGGGGGAPNDYSGANANTYGRSGGSGVVIVRYAK